MAEAITCILFFMPHFSVMKRSKNPVASLTQPSARVAEELPPIETVLLSHDHYDHLDHDTLLEWTG